MNIKAVLLRAIRVNEKKQLKLIDEARKLRGFAATLGLMRRGVRGGHVVRRKKRRKLKAVK